MPLHAAKTGRLKGGRGVLLVDNRLGDTPLRYPSHGGGVLIVPAGECLELETLTCGHCNAAVVLNPQRTRDRGFCRRCANYICDKPGCRAACHATVEMLDLAMDHPDLDIDWLGRTPTGEPTFDPAVVDRTRIH